MFGRESSLPIDFLFEDVRSEKKLRNQSHEQFVKEWGASMEEACRVAKENMVKIADYSKMKYDQKARSVEISVGDHVLMQNRREEKGGTGKLRSYWEQKIFKVIEKRENLPVYKIQNINKKSDQRLVHRNMLMLCNELPLDTFLKSDIKVTGKTKKKVIKKVSFGNGDSGELEQDDIAVVIYPAEEIQREDASLVADGDQEIEELVLNELVDIDSDQQVQEPPIDVVEQSEIEIEQLSDEDVAEAEVSDEEPEESEESEESDDDEDRPQTIAQRTGGRNKSYYRYGSDFVSS